MRIKPPHNRKGAPIARCIREIWRLAPGDCDMVSWPTHYILRRSIDLEISKRLNRQGVFAYVGDDRFRRGCVVAIARRDHDDAGWRVSQNVNHVLLFAAPPDADGRVPETKRIASFSEKIELGIVGQYEDRFVRLRVRLYRPNQRGVSCETFRLD